MESSKADLFKRLTTDQLLELERSRLQIVIPAGISLINSFANAAIKSIMMLNGGAAIAVLAFLGAIISTEFSKWIWGIVWALGLYSFGAACAAIVASLSYISQSNYMDDNYGDDHGNRRGDFYRKWAIAAAGGGIVFFLLASFVVGYTIIIY